MTTLDELEKERTRVAEQYEKYRAGQLNVTELVRELSEIQGYPIVVRLPLVNVMLALEAGGLKWTIEQTLWYIEEIQDAMNRVAVDFCQEVIEGLFPIEIAAHREE
jgi:hypothetical protein